MNITPYLKRRPSVDSFATKHGWAVFNKFSRYGVETIYSINSLDKMLLEAGFGPHGDKSGEWADAVEKIKSESRSLVFSDVVLDLLKEPVSNDDTDDNDPTVDVEPSVEEGSEATDEPEAVKPEDYTLEYLTGLEMAELREIGDVYGVKDNKKVDLANKILDAVAEKLLTE